jgi:hypothetical protein
MKLLFAWLFVITALGWGVLKSVQKAAPLFQQAAAPAAH